MSVLLLLQLYKVVNSNPRDVIKQSLATLERVSCMNQHNFGLLVHLPCKVARRQLLVRGNQQGTDGVRASSPVLIPS